MKAISFELSGKTAIFKKPDVNSFAYFTYNNIHKPALLGLLGGIIGLGGYTKLFDENRGKKEKAKDYNKAFPEYYEKLQNLKISIIPLAKNGYFTKKIQVFNNSVGYASFEQGGNLVVREQWLENPKWQILILENESEEYRKIKDFLFNKKAVYLPYLGKNDHFANIDKCEEIEMSEELYLEDELLYLYSLFIKEDEELRGFEREDGSLPFVFQEKAPISLQEDFHFYEYQTLCFANISIEKIPNLCFSYKKKNYAFF